MVVVSLQVEGICYLTFNQANLLWEQSKWVRVGRSARGDPSLSNEQWVRPREVRAGQGLGEGADEREDARSCSRETEQWSTDKDKSEACKDAKSPTNYKEIMS